MRMPQFILIDPWLADVGGHNFQYALDILRSAEKQEYEPVLAVNRSLPQSTSFPACWNIMRLFRFGMCSRYWLGPDGRRPRAYDLDGKRLVDPEGKSAITSSGIATWADGLARFDRRRRILDFARGCSELCDLIKPTTDDVLFLPSMSEFDLLGVVRFLRDCPDSVQFTWHLQFHFNIFAGRDPEFSEQKDRLRRFQHQFRAALDQIPNHFLLFYATTVSMARQFDHIGVAKFQPLPYPVCASSRVHKTPGLDDTTQSTRPLRVTFAGAMRREKGKKKFGELVAAVWPDCLASGRMQFFFQAPSRQVAGWLPRNLRKQIAIAPPNSQDPTAPLRTVQHPLDAQAYHDLIQQTDVGLFLYDNRRYFARASGILCEMLAAGVPVIVPAGCWLAEQIEPENYRYAATVCSRKDYVLDVTRLQLTENKDGLSAVFEIPEQASDLAFQFDWPANGQKGTFLEISLVPLSDDASVQAETPRTVVGRPDAGPVIAIIPLVNTPRMVRIWIRNAFHGEPPPIQTVTAIALRPPLGQLHHRRGSVGLIAADEEQVPGLLREMMMHYEHYLQHAKEFSHVWLERHDPNRTLEILLSSGFETPVSQMSGSSAAL